MYQIRANCFIKIILLNPHTSPMRCHYIISISLMKKLNLESLGPLDALVNDSTLLFQQLYFLSYDFWLRDLVPRFRYHHKFGN